LPLVYIGAIESMKGVFNILEAVRLCCEKNIKIHFHFIGYWIYESEKKSAKEFIKENNLEKYFTFYGVKTGKEKWDILSKCAILVHPTYWDGVPLTILEALGIGIPVISTSVGGIPDTISDGINGIIISENKPDKLVEAIESYYHNRDLLAMTSIINRTLFEEKYTLKIFINNMERWLNS